jgi:ABC-type multidrug transport system fused ATPase/permease subunit
MSAEETLAWEAEHRLRAAVAAFAAALLTILGVLLTTIGQPSSSKFDDRILTVVDTMGKSARGETIPPGRISAYTVEVGQSPGLPIAGAVLFCLGSLAIYFAMAYLFRAVRARKPELQQVALVMAAIGAVGFGLGRAVSEIARYLGAHDFVNAADQSNSAASDALSPSATLVGQVIWQAAALALGFAFVLIALNAMRVGLLTRFMGVLGIIVGVTFVLPLDQQGIIRVFWLGALGAVFLGRLPTGVPKAWTTGEAEPWPSQQQLREQREAARAEAAAGRSETWSGDKAPQRRASPTERTPAKAPPPAPPTPRRPDTATAGAHSSSKKRKRKRRSS